MKRADCDILVIGGGGVGVAAAALVARSGARVTLLSKEPVGCGDTCIASGLMANGAVNPDDHPSKLVRDLVLCGEPLNDPRLVRLLAERSGEATELLESFGMIFRRDRKGQLAPVPSPLGGHSVARSLVSLAEGNQIGSALRAAFYSTGVRVLEEHMVTDLFTDDGRVTGALGVEIGSGEFTAWSARLRCGKRPRTAQGDRRHGRYVTKLSALGGAIGRSVGHKEHGAAFWLRSGCASHVKDLRQEGMEGI